MVEFDAIKQSLANYAQPLLEMGIHFDLANKKDRVEELDKTMEEPGFWDNPEKSTAIVQESKHLKDVTGALREALCRQGRHADAY